MKLKYFSSKCCFPIIPFEFKDKLLFTSTVELNNKEITLLNYSLVWLEKQIQKDNISHDSLTRVTCIFYDTDEIIIDMQNTLGAYSPMIFYNVKKWRNNNYNDTAILTTILEELCHCYYHYEEEILVKKKVLQVLHANISNLPPNGAYTTGALLGL